MPDFTTIISNLIQDYVAIAFSIIIVLVFVRQMGEERKFYRTMYKSLEEKVEKINLVILFVQDVSKRTEDKVSIVSDDSKDVAVKLEGIRNELNNILFVIRERLGKHE